MGCSWVKSSSNPSVFFFCIAVVVSDLFKHYKTSGPRLIIKWQDMNLCDCAKGEGERLRWTQVNSS